MERVPSALILEFQSTLPLRGATVRQGRGADRVGISIHTPLAGSDVVDVRHVYPVLISIHTPLAGSDRWHGRSSAGSEKFQSTLPLRGATTPCPNWSIAFRFQSTLPLRGATCFIAQHVCHLQISIHTPLAGSDLKSPFDDMLGFHISIHTPLAGSDLPLFFLPLVVSYFNPHSPCGERRSSGSLGFGYRSKFQSTLPLRGATARRTRWCSRNRNFNPHSPCGERPALTVPRWCFSKFQSTLPLRGATGCGGSCRLAEGISIHTPLAGSDQHD